MLMLLPSGRVMVCRQIALFRPRFPPTLRVILFRPLFGLDPSCGFRAPLEWEESFALMRTAPRAGLMEVSWKIGEGSSRAASEDPCAGVHRDRTRGRCG